MKNPIHHLLNFIAILGLLIPTSLMAHPGHQHAPGVLNAVNHSAIGWDQMTILFALAAVLVHVLLRTRK